MSRALGKPIGSAYVEKHRALDHVLELANIARPPVALQELPHGWAHLLHVLLDFVAEQRTANRAGDEPSYAFGGDSMLVGPNAELYTNLEDPVEGYAVTTIDLDDVRRTREHSQILQCRQPMTYRNVVRKY